MGVAAGKLVVELSPKAAQVSRCAEEFEDKEVMPQGVVEDGARMPVADRCARSRRREGNGRLDFFADHVLAEGGERVFGSSRKGQQGRAERLEPDGVANDVRPH